MCHSLVCHVHARSVVKGGTVTLYVVIVTRQPYTDTADQAGGAINSRSNDVYDSIFINSLTINDDDRRLSATLKYL